MIFWYSKMRYWTLLYWNGRACTDSKTGQSSQNRLTEMMPSFLKSEAMKMAVLCWGQGGIVRSVKGGGGRAAAAAMVERESADCSAAAGSRPALPTHKTSCFRVCHSHCWNLFLKVKTCENRETETRKRLRKLPKKQERNRGPGWNQTRWARKKPCLDC